MSACCFRQGKYSIFVTAHRGFSGRAPENTVAAFEAAITAGCDMIELDVQLSRDKELVVIHDETLERTTDGRGLVSGFVLADLKRLDAGAWFSPEFAGERVPILGEALALAHGRISVNIELKFGRHSAFAPEELADRAVDACRRASMLDQVLFSSFVPEAIDRVRKRYPSLPVAIIADRPWKNPEDPGEGRTYPVINCREGLLNSGNIRRAQAGGIHIHAWTVNSTRAMKRCIALGVNGVITNHPDRFISLLQK
jgi:glycerophosphoryl diester phosphodiesterase